MSVTQNPINFYADEWRMLKGKWNHLFLSSPPLTIRKKFLIIFIRLAINYHHYYIIQQGQDPYTKRIEKLQEEIKKDMKKLNAMYGIKETETGLAPPALWDLLTDKHTLMFEQPLQVSLIFHLFGGGEDYKIHSLQ